MKVLVTDGNNRIALAVIRALGENRVKITCVEQEPFARRRPICFTSKYVSNSFVIPPVEKEAECIEKLLTYARGHDILLPISINMILTVLKNRTLFEREGIIIPYSPIDKVKRANNKIAVLELAKSLDISIPETFRISRRDEVAEILPKLSFPVIIKLVDDVGLYLAPEKRYTIVKSPEYLKSAYLTIHQIKEYPLIQEYIEGEGYGFSALLDKDSEVKAIFCHKRLREYPITGGPSTLCQSVYDNTMVEQGIKLLKALNWYGIAMVEFKKDRQDGKFKLMEINPRFWGSLPLALQAGVNFPYLLCQMAKGEQVESVLRYKQGERTRFLILDLCGILSELRHHRPGKLKAASRFLRDLFDFKIKDGIFNRLDLRPAIEYLRNRLRGYGT